MAETDHEYRQRSRPWRMLAAACDSRHPQHRQASTLAVGTLKELDDDPDLGDYGRYRVREFKKLLGVA